MESHVTFENLPSAVYQIQRQLEEIKNELKKPAIQPAPQRFGFKGLSDYLNSIGIAISRSKLQKLTASGRIPCVKFNAKLLFDKNEVDEWIEANMKKASNHSDTSLSLAIAANRKKKGGAK